MPRRLWKKQFNGYLNLIILPSIVLAGILLIRPDWVVQYLIDQASLSMYTSLPFLQAIIRLSGLGLAFPTMLLFAIRSRPNDMREIVFWISLYFLVFSVFLFTGPIFFQMHIYSVAPGFFYFISFIFLFSFASKNILVRE